MKKSYLLMISLSVGLTAFGQNLKERISFGESEKFKTDFTTNEIKSKPGLKPFNNKGVIIWSDDFTTPSNWTINNDGQTGSTFGWTIDAVNDGWWSTNGITSTSGGNYAELSNGDPNQGTQALNVTYTLTTASALNLITLGGSEDVTLEFEQYGARFNDLQEIQISTDNGSTWTTVGNNLDKPVYSTSGGSPYPNPDLKRINLAPHLTAATATSVMIRFSWTTNFPSAASNPNVWVTYGWYIDDVKIVTNDPSDLATSKPYYGTLGWDYTRIPVTQIQPIDFGLEVKNEGTANQTGVVVTADINSGAFTFTSTPKTVNVGAIDTILTATQFTPPATTGVPYTVTLSVSSDSVDAVPSNNTPFVMPSFEVSQDIYARDDFGTTFNTDGDVTDAYEAGNYFDIFANDSLYSLDIGIADESDNVNVTFYSLIYEYDFNNGTFVLVARTNDYSITNNDLGQVITMPLIETVNFTNKAVELVAGKSYFAAVHSYGSSGGPTGGLLYATSGTSYAFNTNIAGGGNTSLVFYPTMSNPNSGETYYTTATPVIRLNFDPSSTQVGINELTETTSFSVYPNPSNGVFNISLDAQKAEQLTLTVNNIVGQTVLTKQVRVAGKTNETISLEGYDKGIYFLTIDNNKEKQTVKLIVE